MQFGDEQLLLEKAKQCDAVALGELYDRYAGKIHSYICGRIGDPNLAEDLTASVFIKMLEAIRSSKAWQLSFTGWLYRIAHNLIVDHYRQNTQQKTLPLDERLVAAFDDPAGSAERALSNQAIAAAISQLTEEQQTVIVLKFFEGLSNLEVAAAMNKTEGAIKSLQFRALATLRRNMEGA